MPTTYAIPNGRTVMDATLYTGTGTTLTVNNTDSGTTGFKPDMIWFKSRSGAYNHAIQDSVRGLNNIIFPNLTNGEGNYPNSLDSFNSNGFTLGSNSGYPVSNNNGSTYVAWQWQAGQGTTSSNTQGTITSTVSANTTAGFSIVTYTGTGSNATVGHGLGSTPAMIIIKNRSAAVSWPVWHKSFPSNQLYLNLTNALDTPDISSVGASTFAVDTWSGVNGSGNGMVAYCWAPIAGYSAFGSYTGNGSTDGPFIYTGFRPKFILVKRTTGIDDWRMFDTSRDTYNAAYQKLYPNLAAAENGASGESSSTNILDILSNGFKWRTGNSGTNNSGDTYIYACFAETPFKYANAR